MTLLENVKKINKMIKNSDVIYIMGHKDLDLDALGAALGMYHYIKTMNNNIYIVVDDKKQELGVKKITNKIHKRYKFDTSKNLTKKITKKSLLLIVDTSKKFLLQNPSFMDKFENIVVIDHHDMNEMTINTETTIIDTDSSSTCEMIAELLEFSNIKIDSEIATILLAGIMLDTNNYVLKTTARTFKISYYLTKNGADPKDVQYILKQSIKDYIERQKVITGVKIINNSIAVSRGLHKQFYRREDLAKIADTLLLFNKIEASFVIGRIDKNTVGISARSMGKINVGKILEIFEGGGDEHEAAAKILNRTVQEVKEEVIKIIKHLQ